MLTPVKGLDHNTVTISALRLAVRQESLPVPPKPQEPALQTVAPEIESCWSLKRRILHLSANRPAFPNMRAIFAMFRLQSAYSLQQSTS